MGACPFGQYTFPNQYLEATSAHYGVTKSELVQLPASEFGVILIEIWVKRSNMSETVLNSNTISVTMVFARDMI